MGVGLAGCVLTSVRRRKGQPRGREGPQKLCADEVVWLCVHAHTHSDVVVASAPGLLFPVLAGAGAGAGCCSWPSPRMCRLPARRLAQWLRSPPTEMCRVISAVRRFLLSWSNQCRAAWMPCHSGRRCRSAAIGCSWAQVAQLSSEAEENR